MENFLLALNVVLPIFFIMTLGFLLKKLRMVDAREVVAIVSMFNVNQYTNTSHPITAYASKAKVLELYLNNSEEYRKYVNIMPDIFDLYNAIEKEFPYAYIENGGRYGSKKYSGYKEGKKAGLSKFTLEELNYKVPDGLIYPTLAAFRSLVEYDEELEKYMWKNDVDPITIWDKCKKDLTSQIMSFAAAIGDNPNTVGKDPNIWNLAYMTVQLSIANI